MQSFWSLIASSVSPGLVSLSYAVMMNGYILGPLLILAGAGLSYYTSMLLVRVAERTGRERYEDIALAVYGTKFSRITSILNIVCIVGMTFATIVFVKETIPVIIEIQLGERAKNVPEWVLDNHQGKLFWGITFSFLVLLPLSLPRNI